MPPKNKPVEPITLTLVLPPTAGYRKLGTLIAIQGGQAVMLEFEYTDLTGINEAVVSACSQLAEKKRETDERAAEAKIAQKAARPQPVPGSESAAELTDDADEDGDETQDDAEKSSAEDPADNPLNTLGTATNVANTVTLDATIVAKPTGQTSFF